VHVHHGQNAEEVVVRVWISRNDDFPRDPNHAAVWVQLDRDRFLWILESGKYGVERDSTMTARFHPEDWEEL
jgi:hypothetical protein